MKVQFKLASVGADTVGGPDAILLDILYCNLLSEFGEDKYRLITINQIGEGLDDIKEFVKKESGGHIHCNIRYQMYKNLGQKEIDEQNRIRLDVVHAALIRIAEFDKKLSIQKLQAIKEKILEKNFLFEFTYKTYHNKKAELIAKVIARPQMRVIDYYVIMESAGKKRCELLIFSGVPASIYSFDDFFGLPSWKEGCFILRGKNGEVETRVLIDKCSVDIVNLTDYDNPPYYTLLKAGISKGERENASKDWHHSLPPAVEAIIRQANN